MTPDPDALEDEDREMIAMLWAGARERVLARLAAIETAVAGLAAGTLTDPVRETGTAEAHKLAGSLGSFGLPEGTRLARELELLLGSEPDTAASPVAERLAADLRTAIEAGPA